jgi:hypothetical protein
VEHPRQPRPVASLHDPPGPHERDVLDGGPDEPTGLSRRVLVAAVGVAALGGLAAGSSELQQRRGAAAEERRAAAAVDLVLLPNTSGGSSYGPDGGSLSVLLSVRNDGPREVEVAGASWAGFALVRPVQVPAGEQVSLPLRQVVDCSTGPPAPMAVEDDVELQVRTASTVRTVALPPGAVVFDAAETGRMCGYYPPAERLEIVEEQPQRRRDDSLVLQVGLSVRGRAPAGLLALEPGPGLVALLRDGASGAPVRLPTELPPVLVSGRPGVTAYEVELRVSDCALARAAAGPQLVVRSGEEPDGVIEQYLPYDQALLADLVNARCPR